MIVQSAPIILKQRNQANRECLYAWYPEVVIDSQVAKSMAPRDIYIYKGIDKDLIQQDSQRNRLINRNKNNNNDDNNNNNDINSNHELVKRYGQSIAPSEPIYSSAETLDEALTTPWALHYDIKRRPATPNPPSHSTDTIRGEIPRRLKSAPLNRPEPLTSILTIPEPRFVTPIIPVTTNEVPRPPLSPQYRRRAASARARLNTTAPNLSEQIDETVKQQRHDMRSASRIQSLDETRLSDEETQISTTQVNSDISQQQQSFIPVPVTPTNVRPRSSSSYVNESVLTPIDKNSAHIKPESNRIPLNPHYIHRPGVITVSNDDKVPVVRESSASRKESRSHRRHHHYHHHHHHRHHNNCEKQQGPLLALTPILQTTKLPIEINGIKLKYDPTLTLDDPSLNITKYFIEGHLYLIKDQYYNVLENIDPKAIDKYNQSSNLTQRPKYYQTIPIEKFHVPKPPSEVHYNASDTYFYNTIPKRSHRYVVDPNFISENLNISGKSMSKRPSTTINAVHSTINDINLQQLTPTIVYS